MSAQTNIQARLLEMMELSVNDFSQPGEIIAWDIPWVTETHGQGQYAPVLGVLIIMKNPLLGAPPLIGIQPFDWLNADQSLMNQICGAVVMRLRDIKAGIVNGTN